MNTKQKTKKWNFPRLTFIVFLLCIFLLYIKFAYLSLSPTIYGKNMAKFIAKRIKVKTIATKTVNFIEYFGLETNKSETIQNAVKSSFGVISIIKSHILFT